MNDSISRQAAIDALAKFVPYAICDESTESYTNGLTDAYNLICQLPSVQPMRKRGRWITRNDNQGMYYECSECGGILTRISCFEREFSVVPSYNSIAKTNFCPSCGADMRGTEDE